MRGFRSYFCVHAWVSQFHALYFHSKIAYWLNQIDRRIDSCDQRMTVEYVTNASTLLLIARSVLTTSHFGAPFPNAPNYIPTCSLQDLTHMTGRVLFGTYDNSISFFGTMAQFAVSL